jgi:tRNA(Ile)-lysidine synthase
LVEKIRDAIEQGTLIPEGAAVVIGVSGGADSVALLHSLHRLGIPLTAAHLNHSIRGADADADEAFVKQLCDRLGIRCVTGKADVPAIASEKGISIEMAAREARHAFFRSVTSSLKPQVSSLSVALAHHADDQIETFFLRAARGTGPGGLGGMRAVQSLEGLRLIRPMLGIRRAEILRWLKQEGLVWREDVTNTDEAIPRNFVRNQLLPRFATLNGRAAENLLRTMALLRDEEDRTPQAVRRREIRDWLIEHGVRPGFDAIERVIDFAAQTEGSKSLDLEGVRIVNEYGALRAGPPEGVFPGNLTIKEGVGILRGPWCASVSLAKVAGRNVAARPARPGDRMEPYGMEGSKKLQDIFTDLKIPKAQRGTWPVVECGGEILWLPGYRIARGWELSSETEPALHLFFTIAAATSSQPGEHCA